jgi:hypothetical protein
VPGSEHLTQHPGCLKARWRERGLQSLLAANRHIPGWLSKLL